jgi:hypothetical protein
VAFRPRLLVLLTFAIALAFAPQAAAKDGLEAKFKVVSASGSEALSFHEDDAFADGRSCSGSTSSKVSWESTRPRKLYLTVRFVSAYHRSATVLSTHRETRSFTTVPLAGKATVSRSVDYQETAACGREPTDCPETTAKARPFLTGTPNPNGGVYGGVDRIRLSGEPFNRICGSLAQPWSTDSQTALGTPTKIAEAIPRKQLLDPHRKVVKGSVAVEQSLGGKHRGATASGTYTAHLKVKLKRLKL